MGVTTRDLGGLPSADLAASRIQYQYFVRFDMPAPTGVLRYTTKRDGYTGNIDGGVATWNHYDCKVGGLAQSSQNWLEVSTVSIANLNAVWTAVALNGVLRDRPVYVWFVEFDKDNFTTVVGKQKVFEGRIEGGRIGKRRAMLSLKPHVFPMDVVLPPWVIGPHCPYRYKGVLCKYAGALPTCDRTYAGANGCVAHANTLNFGGARFSPKPNETLEWGAAFTA